ncbi:F-box/WD repeat-containing protein 4 isoform X2 [Solenopsis invicta]|uniref:F-box/WD repeat-containing protein 4 isoform X2 n=1 Tax=Solenopsis invicta TaxID=13686 RepID=UPI00193DD716|nr:F-box/WD repeat-containing protein 4 isoform X2 [Solenopsis invicta]
MHKSNSSSVCETILEIQEKWPVSYNWQYGIYKKQTILTQRTRLMPWLQMTRSILWWCGGHDLLGYVREQGEMIDNMFGDSFYTETYTGGDICKFVLWKNFIISGYTNGTINYFLVKYSKRKCRLVKRLVNNRSSVNALDASSENLIAGLESGVVKILRHPDMDRPEKKVYEKEICIHPVDKVRSLAIDPTGVKFAVGSTGIADIPPLHVINIECYTSIDKMQHEWKHGAGILDMVWEDPNTLLTCGYDTYIRKWDLRTGKCVCSWADPTDATLYCISSDHQYSMITGTQYNCLAVLWDQRKNDFVQLYYMSSKPSSQRSPVYSLQFDSTNLYCATDRHIVELSFSGPMIERLDYKSMYMDILSCGLFGR